MSIAGRPQAAAMTNPRADRVKDVAKLAGRPVRLRQNRFLAEGPQAAREALRLHGSRARDGAPGVIEELYATSECLERYPELVDGIQPRLVTHEVLAAMSSTVTPQGVIAVCTNIDVSLDSVLESRPRLIAVMVEIRDPGNAGTILRAADAAGADAVIFTASSVDIYNPKTVRSTAGSLFHLPVVHGVSLDELLPRLRAARIAILAADGYGDVDLDSLQDQSARRRLAGPPSSSSSSDAAVDNAARPDATARLDAPVRLDAPTAWLFGNEAQGLAPETVQSADHRVAVPIYGQAESLNVGTAATVCLYASARAQRA